MPRKVWLGLVVVCCDTRYGGLVHGFVPPDCIQFGMSSIISRSSMTSVQSSPSSTKEVTQKQDDDKDKYKENIDENDIFPPPLTGVEQILRAATFWKAAAPIIVSYYGKYAEIAVREAVTGECLGEEECRLIWDEQHETGSRKLADVITSLKGFYVKTAQIIASRQDLFPPQYTEALSGFTDNLDPMPASLARAVIVQELLTKDSGETFSDVFEEFDDVPLGAASVAQVHKAKLSSKYGGKTVAVKIQRPSIESKLLGDIANLKAIAKPLREVEAMPLDYYTVFAELEKQLTDEFDFVKEAAAMDRIYRHLHSNGRSSPLVIPRPVTNLVTSRVLVMDYLEGVPLSRARDEMIRKGLDPDGPEAKLFGRNLLSSLTNVFGRCILESGFFHADPHPGNIFVLNNDEPGGTPRIGLIDFGQVKQISGRNRETLAKVMVALAERQDQDDKDLNLDDLDKVGRLARELGVEIKDDAQPEAAAAVAMWLFDGSVENLPGGYDKGELSPNSPLKELKSFPQDLVLVGRSSILIKGLSSRLDIPWSLAREWAPIGKQVLEEAKAAVSAGAGGSSATDGNSRTKFRDVLRTFRLWGVGKVGGTVTRLPPPIRKRVAGLAVKIQERRERKRRKGNNQN